MALAGQTLTPVPPCFANPLHGRSSTVIDWHDSKIRLPRGQVPVCKSCAPTGRKLVTRLLLVPGEDGQWQPHFRVRGFWATTGFGAFEPDLPRRVLERLGVR
jgi:hypothetical protein